MPFNGTYQKFLQLPSSTYTEFYRKVDGYKTLPIGSEVSPYTSNTAVMRWKKRTGSGNTTWDVNTGPHTQAWNQVLCLRDRSPGNGYPITEWYGVYNRAYAEWRELVTVTGTAQMGTFIAECDDAFRMVATRATQLVKAVTALKKGNLRGFASVLGVQLKHKHRNVKKAPKNLSALWLEYWFGWAPTLGDIYSSVDILCDEPSKAPADAKASSAVHRRWKSAGTNPPTSNDWVTLTARVKCQIGADVQVKNPNLALDEKLGLTNPAEIIWELIPFSFVVDWFGTVGDVVSSWDDNIGYDITRQFVTSYVNGTSLSFNLAGNPPGSYGTFEAQVSHFAAKRTTGSIPLPVLYFKLPDRLSITRAATSVALLVGLLKSLD